MASPRDLPHLLVLKPPSAEGYTPHPQDIPPPITQPPASRPAHGQALRSSLDAAVETLKTQRKVAGSPIPGAEPGLYLQFESQPGSLLQLNSLEDARQGIELVAVERIRTEEGPLAIERATVFVPDNKVRHFLDRFDKYAQTTPKKRGEVRHEAMLDPVAALHLATLRSLWTDAASAYPQENQTVWWEIWLRRRDGRELRRLAKLAKQHRFRLGKRHLQFDDRTVALAQATPTQLSASTILLSDLAEVRLAKEPAAFFDDLPPMEQASWAHELDSLTLGPEEGAPAVCVLDTGVNCGHPLLRRFLSPADCHAYDISWGTHDHQGHGTEMAGLALYGDIAPLPGARSPLRISHLLESVKILPPRGANPPDLYGAITAQAVSLPEIKAPSRARCFSMAVTSRDTRDRGQPTSWSAALDALAIGRTFDTSSEGLEFLENEGEPTRRLFLVSAGNVEAHLLSSQHLDASDVEPIHDPGQAWNVLTVGAYTDKVRISDPSLDGWLPVASAGELSPWSTTSLTFRPLWPLKPDVVFEGGNIVKDAAEQLSFPCPDLSVLTTHYKPTERVFTLSWATSAATAQAARVAAAIAARYPALWPETIRALIVHSARWTDTMRAQLSAAPGKPGRIRMVRRYGFGVPSLERALQSARDELTLLVQSEIHPFKEGKLCEMHLHELPWPISALQLLGGTKVRLRVTLSYFVEPNPPRRGWRNRYRYASHGLRFEVKGREESVSAFRKRLNRQALGTDERRPSTGGTSDWYLGEEAHRCGSLHSDTLEETAAQIADRGVIGIYPEGGWWKDLPKRDRSARGARYALAVSIEAPGVETDLWTPVAQELGITIEGKT